MFVFVVTFQNDFQKNLDLRLVVVLLLKNKLGFIFNTKRMSRSISFLKKNGKSFFENISVDLAFLKDFLRKIS